MSLTRGDTITWDAYPTDQDVRKTDGSRPVMVRNNTLTKYVKEDRRDTIQTASDSEADEDYTLEKDSSLKLKRPLTRTHTLGKLKFRAQNDDEPTDWWFASTAIPLVAATFAPMANMLSIAALVVYWRNTVTDETPVTRYSTSKGEVDPSWCIYSNAVSLICGFVGNIFLLFNMTRRVRYIIALPVTILLFYLASGILITIIVCMVRLAPALEGQVYSQGFWHAIIAASLYLVTSMLLMVNMLGYFLGHYPQHFNLTDEQRNLILQTMLFFLWLGGGAGVFWKLERSADWSYPDALYFCDVTILTIGFGDYFATDDVGRGIVFPFSVGGTIILGLMVSSIHKFARELSKDNVVRKHVETRRVNTLSRAVTLEDLSERDLSRLAEGKALDISRPSQKDAEKIQGDLDTIAKEEALKRRVINFEDPSKPSEPADGEKNTDPEPIPPRPMSRNNHRSTATSLVRVLTLPITKPVSMTTNSIRRVTTKGQKRILMLQERDRFNAMRSIQRNASIFNRYYALTMSIIAFGLLWCLGAMVFYFAEAKTQQLNYFQGLYFCYVSLLTIGYGDLSPRSNAGKAFFVFWSLIAVPTMTILVSDLGDTLIGGFKRGVLENDLGLTSKSNPESRWKTLLHRILKIFKSQSQDKKQAVVVKTTSSSEEGRSSSDDVDNEIDPADTEPPKTIEALAEETENLSETDMMRKLAFAIRHTADDLKTHPDKQYSYEEWVEFTRLIRFSKIESAQSNELGRRDTMKQLEHDEAEDGVIDWDWLDEHSPMTSEQTESEWVLDRLCESLLRVFKKSDLVIRRMSSAVGTDQRTPRTQNPGFGNFHFDGTRKSIDYPSSPPRSPDLTELPIELRPRERDTSPTAIRKMANFFKPEEVENETQIWSKRARAKMEKDAEDNFYAQNSNTTKKQRQASLPSLPGGGGGGGGRRKSSAFATGSSNTKRD